MRPGTLAWTNDIGARGHGMSTESTPRSRDHGAVRRQPVHWSDTGIWEMTPVEFFPFTNDGMDLRKAPDGGPSTLN
jgi:hypothetical protein